MPPARNFAKPKNTKQVLSRILEYIGRSKSLLFVVLVMLILSTLCTTGASYWLKPILNDVESTIKANTFATEGIKLLLKNLASTLQGTLPPKLCGGKRFMKLLNLAACCSAVG